KRMDDRKPNTPSNSDENTETYPKLPSPVVARSYHALNGSNITSPQIASLRLKPTKSTDSLTNHPLQNFDEEESETYSTWSSQLIRRSPSSSSTSSSSSLQPRFSSPPPVPGGSVGGLMLTKLREMNADFSGIVQMLIAKKATLLLPASHVMPFEQIDLALLEDHVIVSQPNDDGHKVITLNGITGFILQDTLKLVGLVPSEPDISTYIKENSKTRKSIFDSILKPADVSYDCPSIKIINKDADILLQGMTIQTIVIESPLRSKEIADRISALKTRKTIERKVESINLPENFSKEVTGFTEEYIKLSPQDENTSCDKIQGLFDSIRYQLESQVESHEEKEDDNENEIDQSINLVEKYVCTALYDHIFCPKWSDDGSADDTLGSKIAALNFYKLGLSHLGVVNPQQEQIDVAVQTAGKELQNLGRMKAPYEKLDIIIKCHRIVVDALEKKLQTSPSSSNESNDTINTAQDVPKDVPTVPLPNILPQTSDSSAQVPPPIPSPTSLTSSAPSSPKSPTFPSEERTNNPNADAIFPLLIYIVVKSNPKQLISNLRFMQRYRARGLLRAEVSYCLTNLLAIVEFLGKMDLNELGLPSDKSLSEQIPSVPTTPTVIEQRVSRRVGQEIVGVADSGLKVITGVVDTSYKMIGRVFGYNEYSTANATSTSTVDIEKEHNVIPNTANSMTHSKDVSGINTDPPAKIIEKELAEISPDKHNFEKNKTGGNSQIDEPKSLTGRLLPFNILPRFSSGGTYPEEIAPPIKRFLDCPDDEFRAKDVQELLSDYKRLSAAIQEL
ncbi:30523_t:CDS:10, partial [Racocetra persica]